MRSLSLNEALRLILPFVIAAAVFATVHYGWQPFALGQSGWMRTVLFRMMPFLLLAVPPLLSLIVTTGMPAHQRRPFAIAVFCAYLAMLAWLGWTEYGRFAPYLAAGYKWNALSGSLDRYLIVGAVAGFFACAANVRLALFSSDGVTRANKAAFGDADWLPMSAAERLFPQTGGIVIGERYRVDLDTAATIEFNPRDESTWGKGGRAPLMTFDGMTGSGHTLFFAGSGGYKTTSVVLPTTLTWRGPIVCLDPSVEIAPMVEQHRRKALGRIVHVLDPAKSETGFNVLGWIETSQNPEQDVASVAHWLLSESPQTLRGSDQFFSAQAHNLLTGLLAHVCFSAEYEGQRTLRSLRKLITHPEKHLRTKLEAIHKDSESDFVKETLGVFINMADQTFSGIYSSASKDTQWLSFEPYASLVCGSSFKPSALAKGDVDVFVNLKTEVLQTYPGIARVIIGSLMNAMIQADGRHKERVLFLLDEVNLLGYMRTLEIARDVGRKYGIALALVYQSIGQLRKHFGDDGKAAFFDSVSLASFAAVGDLDAAREISALCGDITIEVEGKTRGVGLHNTVKRSTRSISHQKRPLIMPHEIVQDMRADEQIVLVKGQSPLRCGRAMYFRRKDMRDKVVLNRFHRA